MTPEVKERIEQIRHGNVPEGYQKTILGIAPLSWKTGRINEICTLSSGSTPRRDNADNFVGEILWVTSGELKKRIIIDTLEKISEAAASTSNMAMYEPGAVVIAIYGLEAAGIRGTASIIGKRCTISQACMAFTEFSKVDNTFFYYWYLNNGQVIGLRYAQGTKQQNLSTDIVGAFPICFPNLKEQRKIAKILTTQDRVIELKEKLLVEKQRQKKYLMQQLITGKKRLPGFSENWSTVELEEVFDYVQPTPYLVKSTNYSNSYLTPVLTAGKTFVLGYTDEVAGIYHDLPVVIFDDFTTDSKYVDFPFKAKSSAMKILKIKDGYNLVFAYEAMQMINFTVGGHERHWISKYSKLTIDAPCLEEQDAIANVISIIDKELALLQQDLEQEKQEKKALMQLLLTGIVRV